MTPIVVCVGLLYLNGFYFSLSNAFIFTIVFGLIIDDLFILLVPMPMLKKKISKSESLNIVVSKTGDAILKTTLIVIICLLLFPFRSLSLFLSYRSLRY